MNLQRVLVGARQAIADIGLSAGYHDVARLAGVGVGTVYRRFPDRMDLLEAVLLDVLDELTRIRGTASSHSSSSSASGSVKTQACPVH